MQTPTAPMPATQFQPPSTCLAGLSAGAMLSAGAILTTLALAGPAAAKPDVPAAQAAAKSAAKRATTPARPKPTTPRQQLKNEASGLALAAQITETINQAQLDVAARVLTGFVDCEFKQRIGVLPVEGEPGWFNISHLGKRYRMLPRETTTGAVRLEDPAAGVVWLQIPTKSMLMNARIGQRMVDSCLHAEQRAALSAVADSIGIVARPETAVVAVPAVVADAPAPAALVPSDASAPTPAAPAATAATAAPEAAAASAVPAAAAASAVPAAAAASVVPAASAAPAAPEATAVPSASAVPAAPEATAVPAAASASAVPAAAAASAVPAVAAATAVPAAAAAPAGASASSPASR